MPPVRDASGQECPRPGMVRPAHAFPSAPNGREGAQDPWRET
jgi:hypothetical protein